MVPMGLPAFAQIVISSLIGGVIATFGLIVGLAAIRLKGDYLAIITLAFGEIVKYIIQNLEFLGGAIGLKHSYYHFIQ